MSNSKQHRLNSILLPLFYALAAAALAGLAPPPAIAADVAVQYTPSVSRSQRFSAGTSYTPAPGRVINAAYRYARGSVDAADPAAQTGIEQVDLSSQWPITRNLSGLARWNWSLQDHKLLEGLVGVEYNAGCWQVRAVAHRFITATQQYSTSFQLRTESGPTMTMRSPGLSCLSASAPGGNESVTTSPTVVVGSSCSPFLAASQVNTR